MAGRTLAGVGLVLALVLTPRAARADATKSVETHGIEVEVPADWTETDKGAITMLAPKSHPSRVIEVAALKEMPKAIPAELEKLLAGARKDTVKITKAVELDRYGIKVVAALGTITIKKQEVDIELVVLPQPRGATLLMSFVKGDSDPVLKKANDDILSSVRIAGPKMRVIVTPTKTKGMGAPKEFEDFLGKLIPQIDAKLLLPRPMPIMFVDCGQANAFYMPSEHNIRICHELFDFFVASFTKAGVPKQDLMQVAIGAATFTFFHEFGHALVGEFGLPITGKGEDAADEVSTLILAAMGPFGERAAFDAALWFKSMAEQKTPNIWYDEHSFNEQRFMDILCLLYGADQKRFGPYLKSLKVPAARLAKCQRDYPARRKAWDHLLEAHARRVQKQK